MRSYRYLTLAVFAAYTLPRLAHRGMFVDGITYAAVARNLAEGRGTFWTPFFMAVIWRQVNRHSTAKDCDWLPILLWIIIPVVSWSIVGNMLETTVSMFT